MVSLLAGIFFLAVGYWLLPRAEAVVGMLIGVIDLGLAYVHLAPNLLCFRYGPEGVEASRRIPPAAPTFDPSV